MDKKRSAFAAPDAGRMTDAELSKRLGGLQRRSAVWLLVGLAGAVSGTVCFFAVQAALLRAILVTVLFFGGVCCAVVFGGGAQKKLKALMHEQLGDFFRSEWEKTFGPDIHTPEMRIDEPFMKALHLLDGEWETCSVENFHEGEYGGVRFSAANVRLDHVYQRGTPHEGFETCSSMVFRGLVLRCAARASAASPVLAAARTADSPRGILTGHAAFDCSVEGQLLSLCWWENTFSLALETDYAFAAVAGSVDLRDLDAVRRSYVRSLQEMCCVLDQLKASPALTGAAE